MNCRLRIPLLMFCDAVLINLAIITSYLIRFDGQITASIIGGYYHLIFVATPIMLAMLCMGKIYHRVWAYASTGELMSIIKAVSAGSVLVTFVSYMFYSQMPRSITLLFWAFAILYIGGSRFAWRILLESHHNEKNAPEAMGKILIYGAGDAGELVAREYKNHYSNGGGVIGFIDDDANKHKLTIHGLPVLGARQEIPAIVKKYDVQELIIALPSVPKTEIKAIVEQCRLYIKEIKILPGVYQLLDGKVSLNKIRPVEIEDLLGREPVQIDLKEISHYLTEKVVLVTGAGGSIGSELCRQVALVQPKKLVLLGHGENSIHKIWLELRATFPQLELGIEIADVRDKEKLQFVFSQHQPNVVFHAAAHKHVPLMEMHPDEAIKTNVFGTRNVAEMADKANCDVFIMISTDKAVNPSSVMGATKRMAEIIVQNIFRGSHTVFAAVRFGNVLGSRGSVVPIFKDQIAKGGPVTVTHPEMVRYFMTIPEAVQLVIQAGALAQGGELFLLDMGEPVKITELATNLIKLSGFEPGRDIEIAYTGVRPGEKLYEELLTREEGVTNTRHQRIFIAKPLPIDEAVLIKELVDLSKHITREKDTIFAVLEKVVPGFTSYYREQVS